MPAGRPSLYSLELVGRICARIAGGESVKAISRDAEMPHESTIYDWLSRHREFAEQYARAREQQADLLFEECLEIADSVAGASHEEVQAARLRVDTRKWAAGKLRPKVYGDRHVIQGDEERPVVVQHQARERVEQVLDIIAQRGKDERDSVH